MALKNKFQPFAISGREFLVISPTGIKFYRIKKGTTVVITEKIEMQGDIYKRGLFNSSIVENLIKQLKSKYRRSTNVGVILNLPGLIFLRVDLNLTSLSGLREALYNYLQINLPVSFARYEIIFRIVRRTSSQVTLDVFLYPKQIIETIITILERNNLLAVFLVHSFVALENFAEEIFTLEKGLNYFFILEDDYNVTSIWLKDYSLAKILVEDIAEAKEDKFQRIITYFIGAAEGNEEIVLISANFSKLIPETMKIRLSPISIDNFWALTASNIFEKVFKKDIVNLMKIKNLNFYLLHKLNPLLNFLSLFVGLIFVLIIIGGFLTLRYLENKTSSLKSVVSKIFVEERERQFDELQKLSDLYLRRYEKTLPIDLFLGLAEFGIIDILEWKEEGFQVVLITNKDNLDKIKNLTDLYQAKIAWREIDKDKLKITIQK